MSPTSSFHSEQVQEQLPEASVGLDNLDTLRQAANLTNGEKRPDRQTVTMALLDQEQEANQTSRAIMIEDLLGTWKLRFTAPKKPTYKAGQLTGKGYYIPALIQATLGFSQESQQPTGLGIQNQLQLGMLKLRFTGPAKVLPKKNLLAFDFDRLQLLLGKFAVLTIPVRGGRSGDTTFETTPVGKLPFFSFFAATDCYLAARGRGGGLALWTRQP